MMVSASPLFSKKRVLKTKYISINTGKCTACWECISACPQDVLGKVNFFSRRHVHPVHPENCNGCLACKKVCPHSAID
ncbi:ferredoxin family protein [Desulfosporosinus sp. PR]|uniref:4Fe-4S dicluster domain-containing protein n=1 Tax=Candidatus Desulfosporosinus nitrosoreducens TaxID=3401928 RepID=UPI0027EDADA6|nr:ferredoxin family protein [Desulfosporosinus sp. PR]MDQ7093145.1 ferredoxin family protein [Desulfosporosinus sp. PR]